ncbi:ATP-binding cassette domain-containing protein [Anaerocolumna sedimenticola]|uniref:ATP-binding cassette domain-containing protein n=1 Tax=Anaerocolumna sedimenticola TaxID=2696063 RepID=A0A6P1TRB7_9FIRM|nr:ABC transporter ATP-binding protein [Anaerocolumna sedimenticola]QHQ63484.1 ATP-binding cassette domain-containing protein [Anaerocolumna sedimenticola]
MVKKLVQVLPYFILAMGFTIITAILDGQVSRKMMLILDYALKGDVNTLKALTPVLLLNASALLPFGITVALTNNLYKKKANVLLKKYYVTKVFHKDIAEFQKENNAKYLSSMTNDFNTLENNLIAGIYTVGNGTVSFLVGIWLISTVNRSMILLSLVIIAINLLISVTTARPLKKAYKERSDMFDGYTSYIKEVLSAFHIVKNYNLQDKVTDDYYKKSNEIQYKGFLIERMISFINSTENFVMNGSLYGVICFIGYFAVKGDITPGGVLLVVEGLGRMAWPLFEISESLPKLFTSGNLIKKMEDTLKNSNTHEETVELTEFKDTIEFQNVGFHYEDDDRVILSDINLEFKKNGKYLIVGPSGGGKSTLLKLFRKYFYPTWGDILIDGYNMKEIKKEQYFSLVANIEQQVFIFEDTIKNNITLYKDYSEEEINTAITASGLDGFIQNLPDGLNTVIYDNGRNISGGERSRIVIARALLNKASILFMDEAFASLDMERAREIENTILNLKDITVINVSHVIFKDTKPKYDRVITVKKTAY